MARRLHRSVNHRSAKLGHRGQSPHAGGSSARWIHGQHRANGRSRYERSMVARPNLIYANKSATMQEAGMKGTLIGVAVLFVCAAAFAFGDITAAKSAENDISSALARDPVTGVPYLRVFVVNSGNSQVAPASASLATASLSQTVTLTEGSR